MSDTVTPAYLRNPENPPPHLTGKSRRNYISNARKALRDYHYQQAFPPFHIPSALYRIVHVHCYTSLNTMEMLVAHVQLCRSFSVDTESLSRSANIKLIQIHTIPTEFPSYVLLIQLSHLPPFHSLLFQQIQLLFQYLFQHGKTLYSWGPAEVELERARQFRLFSTPLACLCFDLQQDFSIWYALVPPFCEVCRPNADYQVNIGSAMFCRCKDVIYSDPSKQWSLQNAILYVSDCYLDKTQTKSPWNELLDPLHSTMSSVRCARMIRYAVYDALAVSYLRFPVTQMWTFDRVRQSTFSDLLLEPPLISSSLLYEPISDEEPDLIVESSQAVEILDELPPQPFQPQSHHRAYRSVQARQRRNRKRNLVLRQYRDRHIVLRMVYHRFTIQLIKRVLRDLDVRYVHLKLNTSSHVLSIGMKKPSLVDFYFDRLSGDLFDKNHYHDYCRRYRDDR